MASLMLSIARAAQLTFSKGIIDEKFVENVTRLRELINQVTAKDLDFNPDVVLRPTGRRTYYGRPAPVTYMEVFENRVFSAGIFIIHPGCRIPLHDHPGMHGIIKVLHGCLNIRSYTILGKEWLSKAPKSLRNARGIVICQLHSEVTLSTEDEPCVLGPSEGNLHEITSVDGPVAFLDILAPPYMDERDCHYYECVNEVASDNIAQAGKITYFKHIPAPRDFWCDSAKYTGPSIIIK